MRRHGNTAALAALVVAAGCTYEISLDNPLPYRAVPPAERLPVPCYYSLDSTTAALVVEAGGYRVEMGPAIAEQLRAALVGLCRGSGRVRDRGEFITTTGADPAVLFTVSATAEMDAKLLMWDVNTGRLQGHAVVTGPGNEPPLRYEFTASGQKRQYFAEVGSGAEGLRRALGDAVQSLVDQARHDRVLLEGLARDLPVDPGRADQERR